MKKRRRAELLRETAGIARSLVTAHVAVIQMREDAAVQPIAPRPEDAAFIQRMQETEAMIARSCGIPGHLLEAGGGTRADGWHDRSTEAGDGPKEAPRAGEAT